MMQQKLSSSHLRKKHRYLLIVLSALLLLIISQSALGQSGRRVKKEPTPIPPPTPPASTETKPKPEPQKRTSEGDPIYNSRQVDSMARITKGRNDRPSAIRRDCPDYGKVIIRAVLHKSGRVIDVVLVKGLNCSYDEDALKIVRRYRFIPAMKDGQPVSEAIEVQFEFRIFQ